MKRKKISSIEISRRKEQLEKELEELKILEKANKNLLDVSSKDYSHLRSLLEKANHGVRNKNTITIEIDIETQVGYGDSPGNLSTYTDLKNIHLFKFVENNFKLKNVSGSLDKNSLKKLGDQVSEFLNDYTPYDPISADLQKEMEKDLLVQIDNIKTNVSVVAEKSNIDKDKLLDCLELYKTLYEAKIRGLEE